MSAGRKRVETLQAALKAASPQFNSPTYQAIDAELGEAASVRRTNPERRRHLLQIMHFCRALNTALKQVVSNHGGNPDRATMGQCFTQMTNPPMNFITEETRNNFVKDVCEPRNTFMHEANAFPGSAYETAIHLGNIAACFCQILTLV